MQDSGQVIKTDQTLAQVEVHCLSACQGCSAQSLCIGEGTSKGVLSAKNPLHAQPGDRVVLEIPETNYSRSLILVFGAFLLASLLGLAAGHLESLVGPLPSPASGILGLFLGLILAGIWLYRHFRRKNNDLLFPVITGILSKGGHHV